MDQTGTMEFMLAHCQMMLVMRNIRIIWTEVETEVFNSEK